MRFAERVARKIACFGEQFTVNGHTCRGVFKVLDSGTMNSYLDSTEAMAVIHPGLLLITDPDAPINPNDTLTRDGRTYTVFKTSQHRIGNISAVKLVILG